MLSRDCTTSQLIQENKSPREVTGTLARCQKMTFESGLPDHSDVPTNPSVSQSKTMTQGNAVDGNRPATVCKSRHTFEKGGSNGVAPNLWNIVGAEIATDESFKCSRAL